MDEMLILVCQNEKGKRARMSFSFVLKFLPSHLMNTFMHKNPVNYAIKKGISSDGLEKHVQGTIVTIWFLL